MSENNLQTGVNAMCNSREATKTPPYLPILERRIHLLKLVFHKSMAALLTFAPTTEVIKKTPAIPKYTFAVRH